MAYNKGDGKPRILWLSRPAPKIDQYLRDNEGGIKSILEGEGWGFSWTLSENKKRDMKGKETYDTKAELVFDRLEAQVSD